MNPVLDEIEHDQVHDEREPRYVRHAGPQFVEVHAADASAPQNPQGIVEERCQRKEYAEPEQAETMDQRVENVDPNRLAVGHRFDRSPALQRPDDGQQDGDLNQADQHPASGVEGIFDPAAQPDGIDDRLHNRFKKPLLQGRKVIAQPVHEIFISGCGEAGRPAS